MYICLIYALQSFTWQSARSSRTTTMSKLTCGQWDASMQSCYKCSPRAQRAQRCSGSSGETSETEHFHCKATAVTAAAKEGTHHEDAASMTFILTCKWLPSPAGSWSALPWIVVLSALSRPEASKGSTIPHVPWLWVVTRKNWITELFSCKWTFWCKTLGHSSIVGPQHCDLATGVAVLLPAALCLCVVTIGSTSIKKNQMLVPMRHWPIERHFRPLGHSIWSGIAKRACSMGTDWNRYFSGWEVRNLQCNPVDIEDFFQSF